MTKLTAEKIGVRKAAAPISAATKLTNAQRTFLSLAAEREDGAGAVPEGMTEKAATKLAATLIEKGLVREVRAKADMPIWRRDEKGRAFALIITKRGRAANAAQQDCQSAHAAGNAPALSSSREAATCEDGRPHIQSSPIGARRAKARNSRR